MSNPVRTILSIAAAVLAMSSGPARSDGSQRLALSAAYRDECGSCHTPYPPQLLSGQSWALIMTGLDRHFGSDASLDSAKAKEIAGYLAANAAPRGRFDGAGTPPRITETPWFRRQHRDGEEGLTAAVWKSLAVKSPANCGACHPKAAAGDYSEDHIRVPRIR